MRRPSLIGQRFGRRVVLGNAPRNPHGQLMLRVRCDCGNEGVVQQCSLLAGHAQSCGCLKRELIQTVWRMYRETTAPNSVEHR